MNPLLKLPTGFEIRIGTLRGYVSSHLTLANSGNALIYDKINIASKAELKEVKRKPLESNRDSKLIEKRISASTDINSEWFTSVEAAEYLRISVNTLRNDTSNGKVPFYKLGSRNRYLKDDLRKLLLSKKRGVSNGS